MAGGGEDPMNQETMALVSQISSSYFLLFQIAMQQP